MYMKLLVSHESPIQLFEESLNYNDYQYCLVHLMEESDEYCDWFLNAKENNTFVVMGTTSFEAVTVIGDWFDGELRRGGSINVSGILVDDLGNRVEENITVTIGKPFKINPLNKNKSGDENLFENITTEMMRRIAHLLPQEKRGVYLTESDENFTLTSEV